MVFSVRKLVFEVDSPLDHLLDGLLALNLDTMHFSVSYEALVHALNEPIVLGLLLVYVLFEVELLPRADLSFAFQHLLVVLQTDIQVVDQQIYVVTRVFVDRKLARALRYLCVVKVENFLLLLLHDWRKWVTISFLLV